MTTPADALARAAAGELLGPDDLRAILGMRPTQFYKRKKHGEFDRFLVRHPIGARCYSGVLVHRYVSGEALYEPTFGAKRGAAR
jgi:hypothetical protein